jgi:hypothetical protein
MQQAQSEHRLVDASIIYVRLKPTDLSIDGFRTPRTQGGGYTTPGRGDIGHGNAHISITAILKT